MLWFQGYTSRMVIQRTSKPDMGNTRNGNAVKMSKFGKACEYNVVVLIDVVYTGYIVSVGVNTVWQCCTGYNLAMVY